ITSSPSNTTSPTQIYTLSLHDALPISTPLRLLGRAHLIAPTAVPAQRKPAGLPRPRGQISKSKMTMDSMLGKTSVFTRLWSGCRSEEHTSELQSRGHLVCRLLLEKKKA